MRVAIFLILLMASPTLAAEKCRATPFPYAREQSAEEFHRLFETVPRERLVEYFFFEIAKPRKPSVAKPLAAYLKGTESRKDYRGFFELLEHSAEVKEREVPKALKLPEVCEIYAKVEKGGGRK